jgi:4,5-DOPA dioxygenase extradiol
MTDLDRDSTPASIPSPEPATAPSASGRMPALYLGHGSPTLVDDDLWPVQLARWSAELPRPTSILVVSAHWEQAPIIVGATEQVPLVYDFSGFPRHYYETLYPSPGAPDLALRVAQVLSPHTQVYQAPDRGLDHGAYVPLTVMYPDADIPVLQMSMPSEDPRVLLQVGRLLAPLRDEGVLIMGSGFMTHSFDAIRRARMGAAGVPSPLSEFDAWVAEALASKDLDALLDYKMTAPGLSYAHPTVDHFVPLFIALGASLESANGTARTRIDGYWMANSKRSLQFA